MEERRTKRIVSTKNKTRVSVNKVKKGIRKKDAPSKKTKIKPIILVDYIFLISLVFTVIFGFQTNETIFFWPFTICLMITVLCMCVIIVNTLYSKIKKKFRK